MSSCNFVVFFYLEYSNYCYYYYLTFLSISIRVCQFTALDIMDSSLTLLCLTSVFPLRKLILSGALGNKADFLLPLCILSL